MSNDTTPQSSQPQSNDETTTQSTSSQSQSGAATDLAVELREMGQQLEAAMRAALESERAKQLQRDLAGGVRELSQQLQAAVKSLQTNPRFQQAEERGRQALSQARQSKLLQDVQDTIAGGFSQLNDQLRNLVDRLEQDRADTSSNPTTQNVPIDQETPSTGETTRLE